MNAEDHIKRLKEKLDVVRARHIRNLEKQVKIAKRNLVLGQLYQVSDMADLNATRVVIHRNSDQSEMPGMDETLSIDVSFYNKENNETLFSTWDNEANPQIIEILNQVMCTLDSDIWVFDQEFDLTDVPYLGC